MKEFSDFSDLVALMRSRLSHADDEGARGVEAPGERGDVLRRAAVALVLRRNLSEAELLVIKRSVSERDHWSGHLALPGGRAEAGDASLRAAAVREKFAGGGIQLGAGG